MSSHPVSLARFTPAFAIACLAVSSPSTHAQDSIAIYGLLDAYLASVKGSAAGVNALDKRTHKIDSGGMTTSRFGIHGTEDLGDGLYASFELSSFIRLDTGASGRSDATGNLKADPFWSREASVSLGNKSLGRIRLGNFSTAMWEQSIATNAFGGSTVFAPINLLMFVGSPLSGGSGWANQIELESATVDGFSIGGAVSAAEGQGGRNIEGHGSYTNGSASTSFAWQSVKKNPVSFADGNSSNNTVAWQWAASYDLKFAKVYGHLGRIVNKGTETLPMRAIFKVSEVSMSVPIGRAAVLIGWGRRGTDDPVLPVPPTAPGGNLARTIFSLGCDYSLSKRTDLYAVAIHDRTTTALVRPPSDGGAEARSTTLGLGIRHRF